MRHMALGLREIWQHAFGRQLSAGPVVVNGRVLVAVGSTLYALAAESGKTLWQRSVDATVTNLAADGDIVSVSTAYWSVYGFQL